MAVKNGARVCEQLASLALYRSAPSLSDRSRRRRRPRGGEKAIDGGNDSRIANCEIGASQNEMLFPG